MFRGDGIQRNERGHFGLVVVGTVAFRPCLALGSHGGREGEKSYIWMDEHRRSQVGALPCLNLSVRDVHGECMMYVRSLQGRAAV